VELVAPSLGIGRAGKFQGLPAFENFDFYELTSPWGREALNLKKQKLDFESYKKMYLAGIIELLQNRSICKQGSVYQVSKKYVDLGETDSDLRVKDPFVLSYSWIPEVDEKQLESMQEDIKVHLSKPMDMYGEFDFVIDCTGLEESAGLGFAGQSVLGEKYLESPDNILRDFSALDFLTDIKDKTEVLTKSKIFILLEDLIYAEAVAQLVQAYEENPTGQLIILIKGEKIQNSAAVEKIMAIKKSFDSQQFLQHQEALAKWNALESYEKVKIPRPALSKDTFVVSFDWQVSSVNELLDREGFFISTENGANLKLEERTFHVDKVLSLKRRLKCTEPFKWLYQPCNSNSKNFKEPGFYRVDGENNSDFLSVNFPAIEEIFQDMIRYFTRAKP
jgi:hypothetical protein